MDSKATSIIMPIVSKLFCSTNEVVLVVRSRPNVVNGGGFVVAEPISHKVVFSVDGCGVLGKKEEMILRDGEGNALLLVRRKGGIVEALSFSRRWNGYTYDFEGSERLIFWLKEPKSCLNNSPIKICIQSKSSSNCSEFEIKGYFPDRDCSIVERSSGNVVAQVGVRKEVKQVMANRDLYHVMIKPGIDQAFVFGVISIIDNIYDGSTKC